MSGIALNPQNVVPLDINTSTTFTTTVVPPYTNVSSGSYLLQSQPLSDVYLQTTDRGNVNSLYFSFSTASQVLIGTPSSFLFQNKNDFNYFPLVTRYSPFQSAGTVYAVAWNGSIWVAGGGGGSGIIYTLASSVDGISWTPRDPSLIITLFCYAVAWNGFLWCAVGSSNNTSAGNVVATSPDGITWTGRSSFLTAAYTGQTQARVAAASFLQTNNTAAPQSTNVTLIGQNANQNFYFSTADGLNLVRYPFSNGTYFWYAAWNGALWVATTGTSGAAATIYTSPDGINWTTRNTVTNMTLSYGVTWSPQLGIWVVCGATGTNSANIQYSYDTYTWTACGPVNTTTYYDVQWSPLAAAGASGVASFIAVGASAAVAYATSATTFTAGTGPTGMTTLFSIAYSPTLALWMVVGTGGTYTAATASTVSGAWTGIVNSLATMTTPAQIAWSQTIGIFVVAGTGVNALMTSVNGTSFVAAYGGAGLTFATFTTGATGVAFNYTLNQFIATGTGINSFLSSPDGVNWTPFGTTGVDSVGRSITWSPLLNQWLMVGTGSHTIATSPNAINWVGRTGQTIFSTQGNGVTWATGLNTYVAVGSGTNLMATSTNGINWVARTSQLTSAGNCIAWNGSTFVAGGSSGGSYLISTSPDSVNWTGRTQSLITTNVLSLTWSPLLNIWVAGGTGTNSLIYSANNGVTWAVTGTSGSSATLMTYAYAVAWNPQLNNFVAGGNTTNTMLTSADGVNWLGMNALNSLLTTVYCVAWNGSLWLAGGTGASNTLASSVDGILWVGQGNSIISTAVYGIAWNGVTNVNGQQPLFPQSNNGLANNLFTWIAVGTGTNVVAYSLTGTASWTAVSQSVITGIGYAVVWYPYTATWVVAGQGTNSLMYTVVPTGQSGWAAATGTQITTSARGLAYGYVAGAGILVAVGIGASANYATSANGIAWTGYLTTTFTSGYGVAWSPNSYNFVCAGVGTNTLSYTLNPSAGWTACNNALTTSTATAASIFGGAGTGQANGVTWNGTMFIAVGQGPVATTAITYGTNIGTVAGTTPQALSGTLVPYAVEATSIDGVNWRPSPFAPSQQQYLAVGTRNPLMISGGAGTSQMGFSIDNGTTWLVRGTAGSSFTTACYSIAFNGLLWVAGGQGTQALLTSKDGIVWVTTGLSGTYPQTAVYGVVWANSLGLWCCVGYGTNVIATSADGLIWVGRGGTIYNNSANAVGWNGTYLVVVGNNSTSNTSIVYSRDGISWSFAASNSTVPMPASQTGATASMAWNGNVWVLVTNNGATNTIYWSANTFTWNSTVISALGTTAGANGSRAVGWNGTTFIVCGLYPNYATSPDGFTWTARTLPTYTGNAFSQINTVVWNPVSAAPAQAPAPFIQTGGQWVMGVTDTGPMLVMTLTSPDSINWTYRMNNAFINAYPIRAIAWSTTLQVWAIGGLGTTNYVTLASSTDGVQLTPRVYYSSVAQFYAMAWSGSQFLAGGLGMYYSSDGVNWVNQGLPGIGAASAAITTIYGIVFATSSGQWTVVGQAGGSYGGIAVGTSVTNILGIAAGSTYFNGNYAARATATNGTGTLVVGLTGGTANAVYSSTSLQAGYSTAAIAGFTSGGYGCCYVPWLASGTWIAVGAGTAQIVSATTPGTWTNQSTSGIFTTGYAVTANNGIIVAVGTGTYPIAYSYNGSTWTGVTASASAAIFTNGYAIAWNGQMFVAGGDNNVQATSPDGVNWTVRKVHSTACYALAYQQREKTLTINNSQWTGRTSQQNFRILG